MNKTRSVRAYSLEVALLARCKKISVKAEPQARSGALTRLPPCQDVHERGLPRARDPHERCEHTRPESPAAAFQNLQLLAFLALSSQALQMKESI